MTGKSSYKDTYPLGRDRSFFKNRGLNLRMLRVYWLITAKAHPYKQVLL
jgi:hypothetical protein